MFDEKNLSNPNGITIVVQSTNGEVLGKFQAEKGEMITSLAQKNGVEIRMSCGAGACGLCLCTIVKGGEFIDKGNGFMQLEADQVLTCIAKIKDECFDNNISGNVIIKRIY